MPAFPASAIDTGPRLLLRRALFHLGLLVVLVPVGVGVGALGAVFVTHREAIVVIASLVLVVPGAGQALGSGPWRLLPAGGDLHVRAASRTGIAKTMLLGAATQALPECGDLPVPCWPPTAEPGLRVQRDVRGRRLLRGRTFTVLSRELHTTSGVAGFCAGQENTTTLANPVLDIRAVLAVTGTVPVLWARRRSAKAGASGDRDHAMNGTQ